MIKKIIHHLFRKHKWKFKAKLSCVNSETGEEIDIDYVFRCSECGKEKRIEIYNERDTEKNHLW